MCTFDREPYRLYAFLGTWSRRCRNRCDEEARSQLPELLSAAQQGRLTIITRHGRPVAMLTPLSANGEAGAQRSLLSLAGSGRGLYGRDSRATVRRLRNEWNR